MAQNSDAAALLDQAEAMRREGRVHEALESVEGFLNAKPDHSRALLLKSRLLYETGSVAEAIDGLRTLGRHVDGEELQSIIEALEQFRGSGQSRQTQAFATESMARLLAEQGYFLEALEVYRQLFHAAPERGGVYDEIGRLKTIVEQEGSRGATSERVAHELEAWNEWLRAHSRGA
jgi:tetratricopeptide (TPR) repeat protein